MSPAITRSEAIERQEFDDGDPDTEVYIRANARTATRVYHEDRNCNTLQPEEATVRSYTRQAAQRRWLGPCRRCVLNGNREADDE